ncbi:MAG: 1-acyl-sn-glycerol-3-phosphate acyltransferase [Leptospiraceae bacterium]|nr:1-acyl-sn-glycerol-3-phosphate acyltransferase [Leptospiraceae bacterium]
MDRSQRLFLLHVLLNSMVSIRVEGKSNVPPKGGLLIVCNHTDIIDGVIQGLYTGRDLSYLAKAELFDRDWLTRLQTLRRDMERLGVPSDLLSFLDDALEISGQLLDDIHILPIIRNYRAGHASGNKAYYDEVMESIATILSEGRAVAIYPEGTRSQDGNLQSFRGFAARVALHARVPVLPAAILGAHGFCDLQSWVNGENRHRTITYRMGRLIAPEEFPAGTDKRSIKAFTQRLHSAVAELMHGNSRAPDVQSNPLEFMYASGNGHKPEQSKKRSAKKAGNRRKRKAQTGVELESSSDTNTGASTEASANANSSTNANTISNANANADEKTNSNTNEITNSNPDADAQSESTQTAPETRSEKTTRSRKRNRKKTAVTSN